MAVVGVADQYMIMMAITLLFTVLAIAYTERSLFTLLAGISWLISSIGHFGIGDKTSALTFSLAWLYLGFGIIFIVKYVISIASMRRERRWSTEMD